MKLLAIAILALGTMSVLLSGCTTAQGQNVMEKTQADHNNAMMETTDDTAMENKKDNSMMEEQDDNVVMEDNNGDAMMESSFSGKVLADKSKSKYLEFDEADYNKAKAEGKIIVLNFYASWCPSCQAEQPEAIAGFNSLDNENVVGFRVNYKDSDTDKVETQLAREFGISYQHTKVIIKDGERVLKSPESWDADRYLTEINAVI